jgi:hypothetical protein
LPAAALRAAGDFDTGLGLDASLGKRRIGEGLDLWKRLRNFGMSGYYLPDAGVVHFVPAEKCSLRFCSRSVEANGVYWVTSDDFVPFLSCAEWPRLRSWCTNDSFAVAGVPWKLFVKIASQWGRWIVSLARRREAYEEYITLRFCVGVMNRNSPERLVVSEPRLTPGLKGYETISRSGLAPEPPPGRPAPAA